MDAILQLAQLSHQELEAHSRESMKTQLAVMQRALKDAVEAAKLAAEVQLISRKLSIKLFNEGSELSSALLSSSLLRDELVQSLEQLMTLSLATSGESSRALPAKSPSPPQETSSSIDTTAQKKRKSNSPTAGGTSTKKRKSLPSTIAKCASEAPAMLSEVEKKPKSAAGLTKALEAGRSLTEELAKKKKGTDRVPGLKMLVQHFNNAHKNLDPNVIVDQIEALDTLNVMAGMAIGIMQQGDPQMKRHWVQKFRDNIADIQEQFPDSAGSFNGHANSLSKIISSFPLTVKEGQQLRTRLRKALEEVKGWEEGQYKIAAVNQNIALVAEAFESKCPNWTAQTDKTVGKLTALLLYRMSAFKDNKEQAKRKRKLQAWLEIMEQEPQTLSHLKEILQSPMHLQITLPRR
ncbi:hypothetical protein PInf_015339 [Phytophthora infestans]|nr:hypothetical protein PInf_015339 [Phytophthora infestans]